MSDNERNLTFTIPCRQCGYKTNVRVTVDWSGNILSGTGSKHEFHCMNCKKPFSVDNEYLKTFTNGFV
jgi:hypothetical protein